MVLRVLCRTQPWNIAHAGQIRSPFHFLSLMHGIHDLGALAVLQKYVLRSMVPPHLALASGKVQPTNNAMADGRYIERDRIIGEF